MKPSHESINPNRRDNPSPGPEARASGRALSSEDATAAGRAFHRVARDGNPVVRARHSAVPLAALVALTVAAGALSCRPAFVDPALLASGKSPRAGERGLLSAPDDRLYDLVISGARIMDPESGLDMRGDIGVIGDRVAALSHPGLRGAVRVDATGLVAAPGFIDTCVPITPQPRSMRYVEYWKLADGITTSLWIHDGVPSLAWVTEILPREGHYVDWGYGFRLASVVESWPSLEEGTRVLDSWLERGGLTVGASPEYATWIDTDTLVAYAKVAAKHGVPFCMHLRHAFADTELDGVREAVEIAERSGARLHVFHLPSTGGTRHMDEALAILEDARARGIVIDASAYVFSNWMTFIDAAARFGPGWREGLGLDYGDLFYVPWNTTLTKETWDAAKRKGGLVVVREGTISWERSILPALAKDWVFVASDGSYDVKPDGRQVIGHPRDTGGFSQALAEARERGIPLMTILRKMTLDPARMLESSDPAFADLGRLRVGAIANIAVFDPATVRAAGTVLEPAARSIGIMAVVVRGRLAYRDGVALGTFGRLVNGDRKRE